MARHCTTSVVLRTSLHMQAVTWYSSTVTFDLVFFSVVFFFFFRFPSSSRSFSTPSQISKQRLSRLICLKNKMSAQPEEERMFWCLAHWRTLCADKCPHSIICYRLRVGLARGTCRSPFSRSNASRIFPVLHQVNVRHCQLLSALDLVAVLTTSVSFSAPMNTQFGPYAWLISAAAGKCQPLSTS